MLRSHGASLAAHEGDLLLPSAPEQAAALFERATALESTQPLYWVRWGAALQRTASLTENPAERTRRLSRALEAFQRAVELYPRFGPPRTQLGRQPGHGPAREALRRLGLKP